ncbi:hypothetical protein, variant 1 [Aphanomyces astaci]|uniref:Uncharacterized protein n=1 Tax=Aphanomyces astaci TaxID=112090 RepID=W4GP95_APHAT|nr:hypothetical protein, variant 1 [Aphanomyces astaci]ETV81151.1 hypothetical protein, variant 1 [Aphanomyces astaci]|eukprot:XP_009829009.1 hypothetical protein, variant 1 [Aphanomyces astaci]
MRSDAAADTVGASPVGLTSCPTVEVHPKDIVVVKTVSRNSYHHPTIQEVDERLRSGVGSMGTFNFVVDTGDTSGAIWLPQQREDDAAAVVLAGQDALVYGDTVELFGTVPSIGGGWEELPVGFLPLGVTGLVKPSTSDEQVLALLKHHTSSRPISPARFVVLPPPGESAIILGKTPVPFHEPVVLMTLVDSDMDNSTPPPVALNNKLTAGVNNLIGKRPRSLTGVSTKGELHVAFERPDAAPSRPISALHEQPALLSLLRRVTLRIVTTNRVRHTYDGQAIGHCPRTGVLVCGHKKTMFEFTHKLHPAAVTFCIAKVKMMTSSR